MNSSNSSSINSNSYEYSNTNSSSSQSSSNFLSESTEDLYSFPRNKIALRFSEDTTSGSKREICKQFWETLDSNTQFNLIMEKGRYINRLEKKTKLPSIKKPKEVPICELPPKQRLGVFINRGMHRTAFTEVKNKPVLEKACLNLEDYEESAIDLKADLKKFDAKVVAEPLIKYSNLPKLP